MPVGRLLEEQEWRTVEKDSFETLSPEPLGVDHLGTCIGLGINHSWSGTVSLLHLDSRRNDLEAVLEVFLGELELGEPYEAVVGGTISSRYDPLTENGFYEESRARFENVLDQYGVEYERAWNDPPVYNRLIVSPDHGILYDQTF